MYRDKHVRRSRLLHAPAETLGFVPDWWEAIGSECVARHSALITAATMPELPEGEDAQISIGFNRSDVHQDAMIGGPEVDVFGVDQTASRCR